MDGIKRASKEVAKNKEVQPISIQKPIIPKYSKREELFIPKEETMEYAKREKSFQKGKIIRRTILFFLLAFIILSVSYIAFFLIKANSSVKKMNSAEAQTTLAENMRSIVSPIMPSSNNHSLKGEEEGRINILLLGAAGEKKPGGNLTDTIMVMSIDTKDKKVAMLSLPRDFFVQIPSSNSYVKINSLYKIGISEQKGTDLIKEAVENITGIKINYFLAVDFDAFEKIIDNIGGINVVSERDIFDPTYPGPNYSYETFSLSKGAHLLDGATALKYVRERHDDPEGDFGRAKRQQQVIQAVKNRFFSMQTLLNVNRLNSVLNTLGENIKTDMTFEDMDRFIRLSKIVDTQNINNAVVDAWKPESLLKVSHVTIGNDRAFILVPRIGNYSEIKDLAQNIFNQAELKRRQDMIEKENASIVIVNQSSDKQLADKIKKLLSEKFKIKNIHEATNESQEFAQTTTVSSSAASEKVFTLDELIKKIPAKMLENQQADSNKDIVITLGNDIVEAYKYEEDTMQDLQNANDKEVSLTY